MLKRRCATTYVISIISNPDQYADERFPVSLNALVAQGGIAGFVLVIWFVAFIKADVIFFTPHPVSKAYI